MRGIIITNREGRDWEIIEQETGRGCAVHNNWKPDVVANWSLAECIIKFE